jgi:NitT/TauT family transport system permease protein
MRLTRWRHSLLTARVLFPEGYGCTESERLIGVNAKIQAQALRSRAVEHHAEVLRGGVWQQRVPGWRDFVATMLLLGIIILLGIGAHQMVAPFVHAHEAEISLSPLALPLYTLRTITRMLLALLASLIFTFVYATLAAKSRRAEMVLIPILDVLQSVPILGYLSFTVIFFVSLFPGSALGPELAAIFAIFTSQAWNMTFSFYQALKTIPHDLDEVSRSFRASGWQRFWRLEVPFAMPGLIWNMMMSMSGGWFFVVASEAISVGDLQIALPGVGSYVARAIQERDLAAIGWAIAAMTIAILLYDQLLFRPMVVWAEKFRFEQTAAQVVPRSWVLSLFRHSPMLQSFSAPAGTALRRLARARFAMPQSLTRIALSLPHRLLDVTWYGVLALLIAFVSYEILRFIGSSLSWEDVRIAAGNGCLTLLRVVILIVLATVIWVPVGVYVGLRPRLAGWIQPIAQFLAAFPANLLFPVAVFSIVRYDLSPTIWLSPLMILGTQWYILFNVIAGATAFPSDLREAAASFRVRPWRWWREVILPGIFPYYVTGAITAAGGAWNASIVSEVASWGNVKLSASGLGAYIAQMTAAGDYPRIALGVAVMSILVIAMNRLLWRPLYAYAERRTRLD